MPYRKTNNCPICNTPDLINLSSHMKYSHGKTVTSLGTSSNYHIAQKDDIPRRGNTINKVDGRYFENNLKLKQIISSTQRKPYINNSRVTSLSKERGHAYEPEEYTSQIEPKPEEYTSQIEPKVSDTYLKDKLTYLPHQTHQTHLYAS